MPYHAISTVRPHARVRMAVFGVDLRAPALAHLWDHRVKGVALAPGAVLLEMAACAARLLTGASRMHIALLTNDTTQ